VLGCADVLAPDGVRVRRHSRRRATLTCTAADAAAAAAAADGGGGGGVMRSWNVTCDDDGSWVIAGSTVQLSTLLANCTTRPPIPGIIVVITVIIVITVICVSFPQLLHQYKIARNSQRLPSPPYDISAVCRRYQLSQLPQFYTINELTASVGRPRSADVIAMTSFIYLFIY